MNKLWKLVIISVLIVAAVVIYMKFSVKETALQENGIALTDNADTEELLQPDNEDGFSDRQKEELREIIHAAVKEELEETVRQSVETSLEENLQRMIDEGRLETAIVRYAEFQSTLININTAGESELMQLNGIGQAKAEAIIAFRNQHGPFTSIEELTQVPGISNGTLEKFRDRVTL